MAVHLFQPSGLPGNSRLRSRSNVRSAVRIGSLACVRPHALGRVRSSSSLISRAASPEVETAEEVAEPFEVGPQPFSAQWLGYCKCSSNPAKG